MVSVRLPRSVMANPTRQERDANPTRQERDQLARLKDGERIEMTHYWQDVSGLQKLGYVPALEARVYSPIMASRACLRSANIINKNNRA